MTSHAKEVVEMGVASVVVVTAWASLFSIFLTIVSTLLVIAWGLWKFWKDPEFRAWLRSWRRGK